MFDMAQMNAAVNRSLGTNVTVYGDAGPVRITATFREQYVNDRLGVGISRPEPTLFPTQADWALSEAKNDDIILIGECKYTVVDAQPQDNGRVAITLRKYAQ